jgi:hypothetical protein
VVSSVLCFGFDLGSDVGERARAVVLLTMRVMRNAAAQAMAV